MLIWLSNNNSILGYTLESGIIGGVGIIGRLDIAIIISNRGGGTDGIDKKYRWFLSTYMLKLNTTIFPFFSTNRHIFPIQFNRRKLRNNVNLRNLIT